MHIETITREGKQFAIVPMDELKKLLADSEMLSDVKAFDAAKARIESGEDELIPLKMVERRLAGESAVKIWREYRELTQENLAGAAGVPQSVIASIEARAETGGLATLKKLAHALGVDSDDLV